MYKVIENTCGCHPDTCCCYTYCIVKKNSKGVEVKVAFSNVKDHLEDIINLIKN